jgi:hypothetical protein
VDAPRRPDLADPEFNADPAAPVRLRDFDPSDHQRLVANPFLAVFLLLVWWFLALWLLLRGPFPPLAVASVIPLILLPRALQYHCLDCGRTGSYTRRHRHACTAVVVRWNERRKPRFPIPSAETQLVFWWYVVGSATLLYTVALLGSDGP